MRLRLVVAALAGLVFAAPAAAAPAACHLRKDEALVAHSASALVFLSEKRQRVTACLRRSGERTSLYANDGDLELAAAVAASVEVAGAGVLHGVYRLVSAEVLVEELVVEDLRTGDYRLLASVARRPEDDRAGFGDTAIRADGTAAVVTSGAGRHDDLTLHLPGGARRTVSRHPHITGVRFSGRLLRWREDGAERSVVATPRERCSSAFASGTYAVGVRQTRDVVSACRRATGQIVRVTGAVPITEPGGPPNATVAGAMVAVPLMEDAIAVLDTRRGTAAAFAAPGVRSPVVNEAGVVAWSRWVADVEVPHHEVWVHDDRGARLVGTASLPPELEIDGSVLRWRSGEEEHAVPLT